MSIEELAFKDRKILANLNAIDLLDIIEFLQEDRNQWINQFTKTHNEGVEIQKENQELKFQLRGTTHCFDEEEHRELKKQLEERTKMYRNAYNYGQEMESKVIILEAQQEEFRKYLEDEIYTIEPKGTGINYNCEYDSEEDYISAMKECSKLNTFKEILQKYKEIIGDDKK